MSQNPSASPIDPKDAGKGLRLQALKLAPAAIGLKSSTEFPNVFGVVMDWPIGNGQIATVMSLSDGNASLYTTSTFGIIGGFSHPSVNIAAKEFVRAAEHFVTSAVPTRTSPTQLQATSNITCLLIRACA